MIAAFEAASDNLVIAAAAMLLVGCAWLFSEAGNAASGETATDAEIAGFAASVNKLGFDLYARTRPPGGNFAMSPLSISLALSMTYAGTRGETAAEMRKTLRFELPDASLYEAAGGLSRALKAPNGEGCEFSLANRLYIDRKFEVRADFLALTSQSYGAEPVALDFQGTPEPSRVAINQWVEKETRNRIRELIAEGSIESLTALVLVNALYFKAGWEHQFNPKMTKKAQFHCSAERSMPVSMMNQTNEFPFAEKDGVQLLEMPYRCEQYSMVLLLPEKVDGLPALEKQLTGPALDNWLTLLNECRVSVSLPRFKIDPEGSLDLIPPLQALGMRQVFQEGAADFSGLAKNPEVLFVSFACHKAFVAVDEAGTEAAAATAVGTKRSGEVAASLPVSFVADHPFIFILRHRPTGAILMLGRVMEPSAP